MRARADRAERPLRGGASRVAVDPLDTTIWPEEKLTAAYAHNIDAANHHPPGAEPHLEPGAKVPSRATGGRVDVKLKHSILAL